MNGFEITELGQVREQENMLERAQSQALRRAPSRRGPGDWTPGPAPPDAEPSPPGVACELRMIARTWGGATATNDAAEYQEYMDRVAMPGYAEVAGNRLVLMLRRDRDDDRTEFTMVTLWADLEAVRLFTGPQAETAVFYPEDDRFLVERDRVARHHVVYGWHRSLLGWSSRWREEAQPA